ncbi:MAG: serine/threonine protein kinase [Verrucomicrobiota bacterium]
MKTKRHQLKDISYFKDGGIATLYNAKTPQKIPVVLRELQAKYLFSPFMHARFVHGIRIRAKVSPHPNIVNSLHYGYHNLIPYEVVEYVPGKNLRFLINKRDCCIKTQTLYILRQIACALAYLHSRHIVHLDLKPENILVRDRDQEDQPLTVKLTDFDLSCHCKSKLHRKLHAGTPSHMAPEQLTDGSVSVANDIFAFGVLAYYLVTGRMPFAGESLEEVRQKQISRRYQLKEAIKINPDLSRQLNWLVMRCLEKEVTDRIPSMNYLCRELERI